MYDLSVKMCKENCKLEKCIVTYMNHVKFLEDENERIIDELIQLKKSSLNFFNVKHVII